jgi:hypothetical protein
MASASKRKECEEYIAVTHGSDPTLATQAVVDDNPLDQSSACGEAAGELSRLPPGTIGAVVTLQLHQFVV